jgi:hypothetical protein
MLSQLRLYDTRRIQNQKSLLGTLPDELKDQLPDVKQLEASLQKVKESLQGEKAQ